MTYEKTTKIFLFGSIGLGVLIIAGLIWAIASGGNGLGSKTGNYVFNDDNDPAIGPADAKAVVRAFGDFQCPACLAAEPGFRYAVKTYSSQVRFIWNDYPLTSLHKNAFIAANAARCAEAQGKFWEYHDMLYDKQVDWSDLVDPKDRFTSYAAAIGLKPDDFVTCQKNHPSEFKINDDMAEGTNNQVPGTPTYFFGQTQVFGNLQNPQWDEQIQKLLKEAK